MLNVPTASVNRWAREKKIPSYKLNGVWRFDKEEIIKWVKSKKN